MKHVIFINTLPKEYTRKDSGSKFWTVLVGLSESAFESNGLKSDAVDTLSMQIFENELEDFIADFEACKDAGMKLVIRTDEVVITEPKANEYINKDGELVRTIQASCWAKSGKVRDAIRVGGEKGDALKALRTPKA